jgi:Tfp pilus assembly protein PilF
MKEVVQRPNDAAPRCELGEMLLNQGERKEALAWLLSALRVDQWCSAAHTTLARYYNDVGEQDMAKQHLAWASQGEEASKQHVSTAN